MSSTALHPALAVIAFTLAVSIAGAARASNPAAEQLFQDALTLMEAGSFAEACPKLEESQKLEARSGTLLNLAYCHEKQGRTATAWVEYKDAATLAGTENRTDNADKATGLAAELEPRLSRLRIEVAGGTADVEVKTDGASAVTDQAVPIDPGEHVVTANASGKKEWSTRITVGPDGDSQTVTVPELETAAEQAPTTQAPPPPKHVDTTTNNPDSGEGGIAAWAWVSGATGLVLAGIAVGFAVDQGAARRRLDARCGAGRQSCPAADYDFGSDYRRERRDFGLFVGLGAVGVVALGVGVVGIAVGASSDASSSGASARITLGPAGVGVEGEF
jgi:hypothetical protein